MPDVKGNLQDADQTKITRNFTFIILSDLDVESLVQYLLREKVFNNADKKDICDLSPKEAKVQLLLGKLLCSGRSRAYGVFLEALRKHHPLVAEKLEETPLVEDAATNAQEDLKPDLLHRISCLETEQRKQTESTSKTSEDVQELQKKMQKFQEDLEDIKRQQRPKSIEPQDAQEQQSQKMTKDDKIAANVRSDFVGHVLPRTFTSMIHRYNINVLTQPDIERVAAVTHAWGNREGASELMNLLVKYKDWYSATLQVLHDPEIKMGWLADKMWDVLGMGKTQEKNDTLDTVKEKVETAVEIFANMKVPHAKDGINCVSFLSQIYYDFPKYRTSIGDHLCKHSHPETCMTTLRKELERVDNLDDDKKWQLIEYTFCGVLVNYSGKSTHFAKSLAELQAVPFMTSKLKDSSYIGSLDKVRRASVVKASIAVLHNIARMVGDIADFTDCKTREALNALANRTKSNPEATELRANAMVASAEILRQKMPSRHSCSDNQVMDNKEDGRFVGNHLNRKFQ